VTSSEPAAHILAEDTDLAETVAAEVRPQAVAQVTARVLTFDRGRLSPFGDFPRDAVGLLVLRGLLIRRVELEGRYACELLGECDVLRPWQADDVQTLPVNSSWTVLEPSRIAILDAGFTRSLAEYPELAARLFERAIRRSRQLSVNMAIVHQARVDERLRMLFWHLASRWGRVRGDGVVLPLRLTHSVLAELVAARRPTVSSALSDLARRGIVRAADEGWLLTGGPPSEQPRSAQAAETRDPKRSA